MAYKSAAALEMAIKAAAKESAQDTNRAIARFYHHRLLCRVFSEPDSPFVLKGGLGMLARTLDARHTKDIDLTTSKLDPSEAVSELNRLAQKDMSDFVSFVPRGWKAIKEEDEYRDGYTVSYDVYLGAKKVHTVSVDLVSDQIECTATEFIDPADRISVSGIETVPYPLYPPERAVADKLCGILERHDGRPSSRVKDLIDIVLYATIESFSNQRLSMALRRELKARHLVVRESFSVPKEWIGTMEATFAKAAGTTSLNARLKNLAEAEKVAAELLSLPLTKPNEDGIWDAKALRWIIQNDG